MLLDGASGLLLVLGISVVLNVVVFMYFRNKTTALENKVDVMFNIVQEHAAINQRQQQQQQMADPMNEQETTNQSEENNDVDEASLVTQPSDENPNLISVSDDESDDDSDDSDDDSEDESDEELENTVIENQGNNDILSNGEVISIDNNLESSADVVELNVEANANEPLANTIESVTIDQEDSDDDDSDDDDSDDSDDSDDEGEHGTGEPIVIMKNNDESSDDTKKLLDIDDIEEVLDTQPENPTVVEKLPELPPNLKKMTVQQLKELVTQRFPDKQEDDVGKMKKKELLSLLKG